MKKIRADDLIEIIGPKAVIGLGNACGEPQTLIDALIEGRDDIESVQIYSMIHFWTDQIRKKNLEEKFKLYLFMMDRYTVEGFKKGFADYIPCR
ncbi:MAG: hypothetical protein H8E81_02165, partial [Deltaproteobacteria bacterium]|nr:hypothetical protein [Deltaproteobacteria bacterium]